MAPGKHAGAAFRAAPSILVGSSQKPRPADLQARERPEPQERLEVPEPDLEARGCLDVGDRGLVVAGLEPLLVPPLVSGEQALTLAQLAEQSNPLANVAYPTRQVRWFYAFRTAFPKPRAQVRFLPGASKIAPGHAGASVIPDRRSPAKAGATPGP